MFYLPCGNNDSNWAVLQAGQGPSHAHMSFHRDVALDAGHSSRPLQLMRHTRPHRSQTRNKPPRCLVL